MKDLDKEIMYLERMLARARENRQPVMAMLVANAIFEIKTSIEYLDAQREAHHAENANGIAHNESGRIPEGNGDHDPHSV
jgi:hypothetical protein